MNPNSTYTKKLKAFKGSLNSETLDKIILPESVLNQIINAKRLNKLTIFEVSNLKLNKHIYSGVLEYSSPPHIASLPEWMMQYLSLEEGDEVRIELKRLRKLNYVKISPKNSAGKTLLDRPDTKAFLEHALQKFTTLTLGSTIQLSYEGERYSFEILEISPSTGKRPGGSIVDTDLKVDFYFRETVRNKTKLSFDESPKESFVRTDSSDFYEFKVSGSNWELVLEADSEDVDLYISTQHGEPDFFKAEWRLDNSASVKKFSDPARSEDQRVYYVAVTAYKTDSDYSISLRESAQEDGDAEEGESCSNCGAVVAADRLIMHETHCRKRLKKCPNLGCAEMLVLGQPEKHVHCDECNLAVANLGKHKDLYHSLMECGCRLQVERCLFEEHKKNSCAHKKVECKYCEIRMPSNKTKEHEKKCAIRSKECEFCRKKVKNSEKQIHRAIEHGINPCVLKDEKIEIDPTKARNLTAQNNFLDFVNFHPFDCPKCYSRIPVNADFEEHIKSC